MKLQKKIYTNRSFAVSSSSGNSFTAASWMFWAEEMGISNYSTRRNTVGERAMEEREELLILEQFSQLHWMAIPGKSTDFFVFPRDPILNDEEVPFEARDRGSLSIVGGQQKCSRNSEDPKTYHNGKV